MGLAPRSVLIPLSGPAGEGRLIRVQADSAPAGTPANGLNARLADLADWGLYEAGAIARGAVRRVGLPGGRRYGAGDATLTVINGPEAMGLDDANNASAELGLALAMLMHGGQSVAQSVIATGKLSRGGDPQSAHDDNVQVLPVTDLSEKIAAIARSLEDKRGGAYPRRSYFFLPERTHQASNTLNAFARELQQLTEAFARRDVRLEIVPVGALEDALKALSITRIVPKSRPHLAAIAAGLGVACILAGGVMAWLNQPVTLSFEPIVAGDSAELLQTPLRATFDRKSGRYIARAPCRRSDGLTAFSLSDAVVLHVAARAGWPLMPDPARLNFLVVAIANRSGVKIIPEASLRKPGAILQARRTGALLARQTASLRFVLPLKPPLEESKIIVLAKIFLRFDAASLQSELDALVRETPPANRINAVVSRLSGRANGYIDFSFVTIAGGGACKD